MLLKWDLSHSLHLLVNADNEWMSQSIFFLWWSSSVRFTTKHHGILQNWSRFVSMWSRWGDNGDQRLVIHMFHSTKSASGKNRSLAMDFQHIINQSEARKTYGSFYLFYRNLSCVFIMYNYSPLPWLLLFVQS